MPTEHFEQPKTDRVTQTDSAALPAVWARGPWMYMHHSEGWEICCTGGDKDSVDHWEWLPLLQRIEGEPGVGGVVFDPRTKKFNFAGAVAGHESIRNGTAIQPTDGRLGRWRNYASNYFDCEQGKKRYTEPGEGFLRLPNGSVFPKNDEPERIAFLKHLVSSGIVEPMQTVVFEAKLVMIENRISTLRRFTTRAPQVAEAEKTLARMRAAWAKQSASAVPVEVKRQTEEPDADAGAEPTQPPAAPQVGGKLPQAKPPRKAD